MSRLIGVILFSLMAMLVYVPQVHAGSPALALDGFWSMCPNPRTRLCFTFDTIANLTTTQANDVLVLFAQSKIGSNVASVNDTGGHVWTLRAVTNGLYRIWEYYTIADAPLSSDRISVTWTNGYTDGYSAFIVFGVSGANTRNPWAPRFPVERTGWDGSSVAITTASAGNFVIMSTAVNDAPPCFITTDILPFQNIGEIGAGVYGEADYFITGMGASKNVSFSCNPNSDPMTFLGDALRAR